MLTGPRKSILLIRNTLYGHVMTKLRQYLSALLILALAQSSCVLMSRVSRGPGGESQAAPSTGYGSLARFPFREGWYGMYFKEDKIGYSHFEIAPSGPNFKISSESMLRLTALKETNEISMKEKVIVRPDLTLISFENLVRKNNKELRMDGRVEGGRLRLDLAVEGETANHEYPIKGDIYHSSAISLMPAMKGLKEGNSYSFAVFNAEKQGVEQVEQHISKVIGEPGPGDASWKIKTRYGRSVILSWFDAKGLAILERGLDGSMITMLEDKGSAKSFQAKKTPGKDAVLDFSLIRVAKPIPNPAQVKYLKIGVEGISLSAVPGDHRQKIFVGSGGTTSGSFEVIIRAEEPGTGGGSTKPLSAALEKECLASTLAIQSDHKEIVAQAEKIVSQKDPDLEKVRKLVNWTATEIKHKTRDSFTALSALRDGEGECNAHANLYTALARSQKIPTRVVIGLVYTQDVGFLYHAWAESYVNGWLAVDPTLNQVPADATHIKLLTDDSVESRNSLLEAMGKIKIDVREIK